jgi:tetratricopeptide (TPR) repeat protein
MNRGKALLCTPHSALQIRLSLVLLSLSLLLAGAAAVSGQDPRASLQQRRQSAEQRLNSGDRSATAWCELLDALYRADESDAALGAARNALAEHPADRGVVARAARALFRGGELESAARLLSESGEVAGEPAAAVVLSKLLHSEGRLADAASVAALCLPAHADDPELHYQLALLNARLQRHETAAEHYARAAELAGAQSPGYPFELITRRCTGRAALHRAVGTATLNEVQAGCSVPLLIPAALPLPTLDVRINGQTSARMLLDLGGGAALSLDDDLARRVGLSPLAEARVADLTGGLTPMHWALTPLLQIGECRLERVATQIYDFAGESLPGIDGIIGAGLFAGHRLQLDVAGAQIRVGPSQAETGDPSTPERQVLEVRFLSGDQAVLPATVKDRRVNGILDIGSPITCVSSELLASLVPAQQIRPLHLEGLDAQVADGLPFAIGRRTFVPPQTMALPFIGREASRTLGTHVDVMFGWDVFKQVRAVTIDYPTNKIIFDWVAAPPGP